VTWKFFILLITKHFQGFLWWNFTQKNVMWHFGCPPWVIWWRHCESPLECHVLVEWPLTKKNLCRRALVWSLSSPFQLWEFNFRLRKLLLSAHNWFHFDRNPHLSLSQVLAGSLKCLNDFHFKRFETNFYHFKAHWYKLFKHVCLMHWCCF